MRSNMYLLCVYTCLHITMCVCKCASIFHTRWAPLSLSFSLCFVAALVFFAGSVYILFAFQIQYIVQYSTLSIGKGTIHKRDPQWRGWRRWRRLYAERKKMILNTTNIPEEKRRISRVHLNRHVYRIAETSLIRLYKIHFIKNAVPPRAFAMRELHTLTRTHICCWYTLNKNGSQLGNSWTKNTAVSPFNICCMYSRQRQAALRFNENLFYADVQHAQNCR